MAAPLKRKRKSAFLASGWIALLTILVSVLMQAPRKNGSNSGTAEKLKRWLSWEYVPLAGASLLAYSESIPMILPDGGQWDSIAHDARQAVAAFLLAFSSGKYEDYERFRFPTRPILVRSNYLSLKRSLESTNRVQLMLHPPPKWAISSNFFARQQRPWPPQDSFPPKFPLERLNEERFYPLMIEHYSLNTGYKDYFEAISLTNSYIKIQKTREIPSKLETLAASEDNIGLSITGTRYYQFERGLDDILKEDGELLIVTCKLMVRLRAPDTVTPYYIRYYYEPKEQKLLPSEFVVASIMAGTYALIWF